MRLSVLSITLALTFFVAAAPLDQLKAGDVLRRTTTKLPTTSKPDSSSANPPTTPKTESSSTKPATSQSGFSGNSKPPTTPKTGSSNSRLPTTPKSSKPTTGKTCPAPQSVSGSKKSKRAGVRHPPGKSNVVLFHGTENEKSADTLKSPVDLGESAFHGDLHSIGVGKEHVQGGFYLTDSFLAAAQFACSKLEPTAYVLEFQWNGAKLPVKDYQAGDEFEEYLEYDKTQYNEERNPDFDQIMKDNDMVTGPMKAIGQDYLVTKWFWQYAVIKQQAATSNLKYVTRYEIACSAVPIKDKLTDVLYSASQKSSPEFDEKIKEYTECTEGQYDWQKAAKEAS
ncbi:hypothetical protein GYMLUDRAFT_56662 [Collybiopsis luxurians FD-317 M1]|nr:hypothetical protein GYMLUDRAFT_56662 [Collybiopsis luxurians FD-317 M1]